MIRKNENAHQVIARLDVPKVDGNVLDQLKPGNREEVQYQYKPQYQARYPAKIICAVGKPAKHQPEVRCHYVHCTLRHHGINVAVVQHVCVLFKPAELSDGLAEHIGTKACAEVNSVVH